MQNFMLKEPVVVLCVNCCLEATRGESVNPQDYILAPLLSILQIVTLYSVTQALSLLL